MIVYFDFDHTLFDTGRLKRDLRDVFVAGGISAARFEETYRMLVNGPGYDPAKQADMLAEDWRDEAARKTALAKTDKLLSAGGECVFEGAFELLSDLRGRGDRLVLLTRGSAGWQRAKLSCSGLAGCFDQVEITADLKAGRLVELVGPDDSGVMIDDNPGELAEMMAVRPKLRCIYFSRSVNPYPGPGCEEADSMARLRHLLLG